MAGKGAYDAGAKACEWLVTWGGATLFAAVLFGCGYFFGIDLRSYWPGGAPAAAD